MAGPRDLQPDDPLTASWLNSLLKLAKRKNAIKFLPPLYTTDDGDVLTIRFSGPQEAYFSITGGTNPYAGTELKADSGGAWSAITGGRTPTTSVDPLYERNANTAVPAGSVVLARRATATSSWVFPFSACSGSTAVTPSTPTGPTPTPPPAPGPGPSPGPAPAPADPLPTDPPLGEPDDGDTGTTTPPGDTPPSPPWPEEPPGPIDPPPPVEPPMPSDPPAPPGEDPAPAPFPDTPPDAPPDPGTPTFPNPPIEGNPIPTVPPKGPGIPQLPGTGPAQSPAQTGDSGARRILDFEDLGGGAP